MWILLLAGGHQQLQAGVVVDHRLWQLLVVGLSMLLLLGLQQANHVVHELLELADNGHRAAVLVKARDQLLPLGAELGGGFLKIDIFLILIDYNIYYFLSSNYFFLF
jgi:hypothetical protein